MRKYLILLFMVSLSGMASSTSPAFESEKMNNISSHTGSLSVEKNKEVPLGTNIDTYTYMRCHYRISPLAANPSSSYEWAISPGTSHYYQLKGYWWSDLGMSWSNMFYSAAQQDDLRNICQKTLIHHGVMQPVAMLSAADNQLSFNHTIWSNDSADQGNAINKIIAFGDSLTDINNASWLLPNRDSWFLGRFSNGATWVEYFSTMMGLPMYNWAVGGAASDQQSVIPGILQQVDSWLVYMKSARNYRPENSLFTVWIGANDIVTYHHGVDNLIKNQTEALRRLIGAGAKNVLVFNLPDISRAPEFQFRNDANKIAQQVNDYNMKIKAVINKLNSTYGTNALILFDVNALFDDMLNNPEKYNIENTSDSCLDINISSPENYFTHFRLRTECTDPDKFVFWDLLHPTTNTHRLLAEHLKRFIINGYKS